MTIRFSSVLRLRTMRFFRYHRSLIIAIEVVGLFYEGDSFGYIHSEIAALVGENAATTIASTITSVHASEHGFTATVISIVLLLMGAAGVFVQLQNAMNHIWGVMPKPGHFVKDFVKQRLMSFAMVLVFSVLLLVSLLISSTLAAITGYLQFLLPGAGFSGTCSMRWFHSWS